MKKLKPGESISVNFTGIVEFSNGDKHWYLNGKFHRETGPCTVCKDCLEGNFEPALAKPKTCSKPGPAVAYSSGTKYWYLNGKLHNDHGPAIIYSDGEKHWFLNGELYREDGPAIVCPDGEKHWYLNGKLHREDGPAVVYPNGEKHWYLNGKEVDFQAFELYYILKFNKEYIE